MKQREIVWTRKAQMALDQLYAYWHDQTSPQRAWTFVKRLCALQKAYHSKQKSIS